MLNLWWVARGCSVGNSKGGREEEGVYRNDDRWRDNETKISTDVTH